MTSPFTRGEGVGGRGCGFDKYFHVLTPPHTRTVPNTRAISASMIPVCLTMACRQDSTGIKKSENTRTPGLMFSEVRGCQAKARLVALPASIRLRRDQPRAHGITLARKTPALTSLCFQLVCMTNSA